jgi:hypothetical protein
LIGESIKLTGKLALRKALWQRQWQRQCSGSAVAIRVDKQVPKYHLLVAGFFVVEMKPQVLQHSQMQRLHATHTSVRAAACQV